MKNNILSLGQFLEKTMLFVDTVFCLPSICMLDSENSKKKKKLLFLRGLWEHQGHHGLICSGIEVFKVPFYDKMTKMPLVN